MEDDVQSHARKPVFYFVAMVYTLMVYVHRAVKFTLSNFCFALSWLIVGVVCLPLILVAVRFASLLVNGQ